MRGEVIPPQPGREEPTPGRFVVALLLFVLLAATCLLLLLAALREPLARIGERLETVYEVARTAREGYRWITAKALPLLALFSLRPRPQEPRRGECPKE